MKIKNLCHEDYNAMQKTTTGKHCTSCSQNVTDFTDYSEKEIQAYFLQHKNEIICGRYKNFQINTPTPFEKIILKLKSLIELNIKLTPIKLALLALISSLMSLTSCFMGKRMDGSNDFDTKKELVVKDSTINILEADSIKKH